MLQLKNHSPFESTISLFPNEQGIDTLYVVVKATFNIGPALSVSKKQVPPVLADEYWGDPLSSSIKYASDIHLAKPSTDVVVIGRARPPNSAAVSQLDVHFSIAELNKTLRVFGNRVWKNGSVSAAEPFESIPVVYEYAFGGKHEIDIESNDIMVEERNPVGRGFLGKRKNTELDGLALPNIEDPQCLVTHAGDKAIPAGFAFISPTWLPRRNYAGTYDEDWQKNRAPYMPNDFNPRFFNVAHPDFTFDRYLQGGESVALNNLSIDGPVQFLLPVCNLETAVRVAGKVESPQPNLETVLIEPEKRRLCLTWRSQLLCDKKALKIEQVDVNLLNLQLNGEIS